MLNIDIIDGDLHLSLSSDGIEHVKDLIANNATYDCIYADLFEDYACNGSYAYFNAGDGNPYVGLTNAPCIAESLNVHDDGRIEIVGLFWYLADYQIIDDIAILSAGGTLTFTQWFDCKPIDTRTFYQSLSLTNKKIYNDAKKYAATVPESYAHNDPDLLYDVVLQYISDSHGYIVHDMRQRIANHIAVSMT